MQVVDMTSQLEAQFLINLKRDSFKCTKKYAITDNDSSICKMF